MKVLIASITATIVSMGIMIMCTIISKTMTMDREKMTPFECGFDPKSSARIPFSIQFFLIAVLFLIFDVEIAIMIPMMITMKTSNIMTWALTTFVFVTTLILGLYYEWKTNMLEWSK
uniref:NADH-ubiquinone oxidoreductase chain 3 n=1 Tax=Tropidothorax cruciger TaxID=1310363 RepID=A0A7T1TVH6_9HEMI|nr:NADH dehydrogenase subunit 3 [Tropidothorax cruciger]QPP20742.1 NADH dehydrogenase subunit 3 [Tropidothorax cruciger]